MKNTLTNLFSSLAFRVLFALATIGSTANAHDLPYGCPLANDAWEHLSQNCLGNDSLYDSAPNSDSSALVALPNDDTVYFALAPNEGESPSPESISSAAVDVSCDSVPFCYDGVDCAKLEGHYRNSVDAKVETNLDAGCEDAEEAPTIGSHQNFIDVAKLAWPTSVKPFRLDNSCESAGPCNFESSESDSEVRPPLFMFRRHCVEDITNHPFTPLVWRQYAGIRIDDSDSELAIAMPTVPQVNSEMLSTALDRLAQWDCQLNAEFWDCQSAYLIGRQIGAFSSHLQQRAVSSLGDLLATWSKNLTKSNAVEMPMYVLYQTSAGDPMLVPMPIARDWQIIKASEDLIDPSRDDEAARQLSEVVNVVNARLKWAGGRMSSAINYIQDWWPIVWPKHQPPR